jgi:hypothetical protein
MSTFGFGPVPSLVAPAALANPVRTTVFCGRGPSAREGPAPSTRHPSPAPSTVNPVFGGSRLVASVLDRLDGFAGRLAALEARLDAPAAPAAPAEGHETS